MLIENGVDLEPVDKKGKLPINYAQKKLNDPNFKRIYDYLISKGAKLTWKTDS